jgi:hypothetical protein
MENIRGQGDCSELKPPFLESLSAIFLNCEIDHLGVLRAPYFSPFPLILLIFYFFCCSYMQTIGRWRIFSRWRFRMNYERQLILKISTT